VMREFGRDGNLDGDTAVCLVLGICIGRLQI
jgi:hypothetical protein